jgi:hypothetical protein
METTRGPLSTDDGLFFPVWRRPTLKMAYQQTMCWLGVILGAMVGAPVGFLLGAVLRQSNPEK